MRIIKTEIFMPFEEKKEKIKEISEEFFKKWIIENRDDDILIWHFLAFVDLQFQNETDMMKEEEIVLELYHSWSFMRQTLNGQLNYSIRLIYNLFLKIKTWQQNKKR